MNEHVAPERAAAAPSSQTVRPRPSSRKRKNGRGLVWLALAALLAAGGVGYWYAYGPDGTTQDGFIYDRQKISKGNVRRVVSTSGPVRALVTVSVGSQLSGQVAKLHVDYNSEVKEGQALAALDDATFKARVNQAQADLMSAKATVEVQRAALLKAEAQLAQAERAKARSKALAEKGIAAQSALDTAIRDSEVATADIASAKAGIANAMALVAQREAALNQSQIDLDRTQIRSPINGTVISRTIDEGQTVAASLQAPELFKIAQDLSRIRIEAQVNEADVGAISPNQPVTFTVDAYPERKFNGKVTQVRLAATELQNVVTYTVIIEAQNDDRKLFPGMTANAQIETATRDNVLRVPNDALRFKPKGATGDTSAARTGPASAEQRAERIRVLMEDLKAKVGFSDEQVQRLTDIFEKAAASRRAGGGGAGAGGAGGGEGEQRDPAAARARFQERIDKAIASVLTPEQKPAFEKWRIERDQTRSATVWVPGAKGELVQQRIRIGVADDQYSEIISGPVKEGTEVVVRARKAPQK